jgi:hypothetical protein
LKIQTKSFPCKHAFNCNNYWCDFEHPTESGLSASAQRQINLYNEIDEEGEEEEEEKGHQE